jgi:putative addiction module component (TIGR02574 family)
MHRSYEQVRQLASELSDDQRLMLANAMLESLNEAASANDAELSAAWSEEIARRVAEIKAGTASTCSLDEMAADLRKIAGQ